MKYKIKPRSDRIGRRRLYELADLLERDAKNKKGVSFDMNHWGYTENPDNPISCGTSACAMGLAALSGEFKKAGLTYEFSELGELDFRFKGRFTNGVSAARRLFKIPLQDAYCLFTGGVSYGTGAKAERHMARALRAYADGKTVKNEDGKSVLFAKV